jgi:hypothetical protein
MVNLKYVMFSVAVAAGGVIFIFLFGDTAGGVEGEGFFFLTGVAVGGLAV